MNKPAIIFGILVGVAIGYYSPTWASRNDAGTYSLPAGNPVVTNTKITSSWANTTLGDVRTEITASLDRNGRGAMLAPLMVTAGTKTLPSVTTSGDLDTGLYHPAANQWAVTCADTQVQQWTATGTSITGTCAISGAVTATAGVAATNSSVGNGITSTGNASGTGITATGGTSAARGGNFIGGANADGGTGGIGVYGAGGANDGIGVYGYGNGAAGSGGQFAGGASSGIGVVATGGGTGYGVYGTGGASAVGGYFSHGTAATAATRQDAVALGNGDLSLNGVANPNSNVAMLNRLSPKNIIKAWAQITSPATIVDGFNIASVSCATNTMTVTIAQDLSSSGYAVLVSPHAAPQFMAGVAATAGAATVVAYTLAGVQIDMCTVATTFSIVIVGAQ